MNGPGTDSRARFVLGGSTMAPAVSSFEDHFAVDDHVADDQITSLGECFQAVAEAIIGNDSGAQFAGKGQDEIVGIGTGRCLADGSCFHELLEFPGSVDLMAQGRIGQYHRPIANFLQPAHHQLYVFQTSGFAFAAMRYIGAVDDDCVVGTEVRGLGTRRAGLAVHTAYWWQGRCHFGRQLMG